MGRPAGEILLYRTDDGRTRIECRFADESLWLSQALMAELFQTTPQNVTQHLKALYQEGEIEERATCKHFLQVQTEGERRVQRRVKHYNLDAILAVGYRVRSPRGTQFRQWATERLREYLVKGFTMDDERIKQPPTPALGLPDYFDELLERIRDIRASEARMYLRVREIFALPADYEPAEKDTTAFFRRRVPPVSGRASPAATPGRGGRPGRDGFGSSRSSDVRRLDRSIDRIRLLRVTFAMSNKQQRTLLWWIECFAALMDRPAAGRQEDDDAIERLMAAGDVLQKAIEISILAAQRLADATPYWEETAAAVRGQRGEPASPPVEAPRAPEESASIELVHGEAGPCVSCEGESGAGPVGWRRGDEPGPLCASCLARSSPDLGALLGLVDRMRRVAAQSTGETADLAIDARPILELARRYAATNAEGWPLRPTHFLLFAIQSIEQLLERYDPHELLEASRSPDAGGEEPN